MARLAPILLAAVFFVLVVCVSAGKHPSVPPPPPPCKGEGPACTDDSDCSGTTNFCDNSKDQCSCCDDNDDCDEGFHCYLGVCEQTPDFICGGGDPTKKCKVCGTDCVAFPPFTPGSCPTVSCVRKCTKSSQCFGRQTCKEFICQ